MNISVIGAGSWGTTLADLLARKGYNVQLWVRKQELLAEIRGKMENTWYLPGKKLARNLLVNHDIAQVVDDASNFVFAVPSQHLRGVYEQFLPYLPKKPTVVCASKGIELGTLMTMSAVCNDVLGPIKPRFAMLSGPSFAYEVLRDAPTAVSLGCADKKVGQELQETFSTNAFRVYYNKDVKGVELGGALKNIIAIAAGVADGLGFGSNARAALITRGLVEMARLGKSLGADPRTFHGLSGVGDLVLTCTGDMSRNRQVGLRLGQGQKLLDILASMTMVAEGVKTTEAVYELGQKNGQELPITNEVYNILYNEKDPTQAVMDLMTRGLKEE